MNLKVPSALLQATRLVRGGNLIEATAAIQRALRGGVSPAPARAINADALPVEGRSRVIDAATATRARGQFVSRKYMNSAGALEYKIYIPGVYDGEACPLVVMLHGCKQGPDDFAAATRMNALAEELGFIVVYPKQADQANVSKCWNWFQAQHQQRDHGEPSLIAGLTRDVVAAYGLDERRVYVAGLSAGGAMAAIMGTLYSDLYAAAGIHSGLAYAAAGDMPSAFAAMRGESSKRASRKIRGDASTRSVPTIVFHGDSDTTVHPSNGDGIIAQASPGRSASGARENGPAEHERTVEHGHAGGHAYTRTIFRDSTGKPIMEQWLIHGAAHAWSGGSAEGSFSDPNGPDASREMLRFFLQQER